MNTKDNNNTVPFTALSSISVAAVLAASALTLAPASAQAASLFMTPTLSTYGNISASLGVEKTDTLVPTPQFLNFVGSGGIAIQRGDEFRAETFLQDPQGQLVEAIGIAEAPRNGDFELEVFLEDQQGNTFDIALSPTKGNLPAIVVSEQGFQHSINANAGFDYRAGEYAFGGAINFEVDDITTNTAEISSAFVYASSQKYGTLRFGRGLSLPFGTQSPEVVAGGGYSFADYGDWQLSYVTPVWQGFRAGVLAGRGSDGKISLGGSAQYQTTIGDNQFRVGGYADTAKSWQALAGYTRRVTPTTFAGVNISGGNDGGREAFASVEATLEYKRHFLRANYRRVWSNQLDLFYANNGNPFFSVSVLDTTLFNREDVIGLGYNFNYSRNLQFYANAEFANHKFFPTRKDFSAGIRVAF